MVPKIKEDRQAAHQRGNTSETLAVLWLRLKLHAGEIDLVAAAPPFGPVCLVEVKAQNLARTASLYLTSRSGLARRGARFDIIAIAPRSLPMHHRDVWRPEGF